MVLTAFSVLQESLALDLVILSYHDFSSGLDERYTQMPCTMEFSRVCWNIHRRDILLTAKLVSLLDNTESNPFKI